MFFIRERLFCVIAISSLITLLSGCGVGPSLQSSSALPQISGIIHGGQQPVAGATIQLYAANTTTSKGASTAMLTNAVVTTSGGTFNITGDYTCPTPSTLVYLVATGGNPGLPGTVNNTALALMAVIGTCSTLESAQFISVNELTTVASVEALAPFMADYTHVGTTADNVTGLVGAFANATALVNFQTGAFNPVSSGVMAPTQTMNTLADILAACANTAGGTFGDTSACGKLLSYSSSATISDTIAAMLGIVQSPAANVASLYGLIAGTGVPFQPYLASAPKIFVPWTAINLGTDTSGPYNMTIDTSQNVWLSHGNSTYVYSNSGSLLYTIPVASFSHLEADPFGNVWGSQYNYSVDSLIKFTSTGTATTYTFPNLLSPDVSFNFMTLDSNGNIWTSSGSGLPHGVIVDNCYVEFSNSAAVVYSTTSTNPRCSVFPSDYLGYQMTHDGAGNVYADIEPSSGVNAIYKISGAGTLQWTSVLPAAVAGNLGSGPATFPFDRTNQELWVSPWLGSAVSLLRASDGSSLSGSSGFATPYGSAGSISATAVDGSGNLWIQGGLGELSEMTPTGSILTPNLTGGSHYDTNGYHVGPQSTLGGALPEDAVAIDAYGNIWSISGDNTSVYLVKTPGLAAPKNYQ